MKSFLTIDFEDISHDLTYNLGVRRQLTPRIDALKKSFREIDALIKKHSEKGFERCTFFVTGVVCEFAPDLIQEIALAGHEIACHSYYHVALENCSFREFEWNLRASKEILENTINKSVVGFRAPYFRIMKTEPDQYQLVEKLFDYDSSLCVGSLHEVNQFKENMGLQKLKIIPIFSKKNYGIPIKSGGTFLKIFPTFIHKANFSDNKNSGMDYIIYLHPYEFSNSFDWHIKLSEFSGLSFAKTLFWYARQYQWIGFGQKGIPAKISATLNGSKFSGTLREI